VHPLPNFKHDHTQKHTHTHTHTLQRQWLLSCSVPHQLLSKRVRRKALKGPLPDSLLHSLFADSEGDSACLQQKVRREEGNREKVVRNCRFFLLVCCPQSRRPIYWSSLASTPRPHFLANPPHHRHHCRHHQMVLQNLWGAPLNQESLGLEPNPNDQNPNQLGFCGQEGPCPPDEGIAELRCLPEGAAEGRHRILVMPSSNRVTPCNFLLYMREGQAYKPTLGLKAGHLCPTFRAFVGYKCVAFRASIPYTKCPHLWVLTSCQPCFESQTLTSTKGTNLLHMISQNFAYSYSNIVSNSEIIGKFKLKLVSPPILRIKAISHVVVCQCIFLVNIF
jgi:hypothetical protein